MLRRCSPGPPAPVYYSSVGPIAGLHPLFAVWGAVHRSTRHPALAPCLGAWTNGRPPLGVRWTNGRPRSRRPAVPSHHVNRGLGAGRAPRLASPRSSRVGSLLGRVPGHLVTPPPVPPVIPPSHPPHPQGTPPTLTPLPFPHLPSFQSERPHHEGALAAGPVRRRPLRGFLH